MAFKVSTLASDVVRGSVSSAITRRRGRDDGERVDVGARGRVPDGEPQRAVGVDTHRFEHGRRLERFRCARAARVRGDARAIEAQQHGLRFDAADSEADEMRDPVDRVTELRDVGYRRRRCAQRIGQRSCVLASSAVARSSAVAAPKPTIAGMFSTRAPRPFLVAPDEQRREAQSAPYQQRARARRPAQLVRAHRQEVGAERVEGDGHVTGRLRGVDMHQHAEFTARRYHFDDGLQRADFVIGPLHVHERGVGANGGLQCIAVDAPETVDGHDDRISRAGRPRGRSARLRRRSDGSRASMRPSRPRRWLRSHPR